jgi:hypothetical protein
LNLKLHLRFSYIIDHDYQIIKIISLIALFGYEIYLLYLTDSLNKLWLELKKLTILFKKAIL